jgi:ribosomal protein L11 methyltransferase
MFEESQDGLQAFAKAEELTAQNLAEIREDLAPLGLIDWVISEVEEENWNAQWESDYPEVHIDHQIRIRAPFHSVESEIPFRHTLTIQPRMAFGTGHHGTTHGLLAEMVEMEWTGLDVLDMGCGSGVLGIHAAMQGAKRVLCVDIDPWSVSNTRENAPLNGVKEGATFEVREGGADVLHSSDEGRFDVVVANINRNILLQDMPAYSAALKPEGVLMLSGFMAPDVEALEQAAGRYGLQRMALRSEKEWRILTLRR